MRDPNNGELIVNNEQIKNVTPAYFLDNLTKKLETDSNHNGLDLKSISIT